MESLQGAPPIGKMPKWIESTEARSRYSTNTVAVRSEVPRGSYRNHRGDFLWLDGRRTVSGNAV